MRYLVLILTAVLLSGCVAAASRAVTEAGYVAGAASDYVREAHDLRRWIRQQCFDLLKTEIRQLGEDTKRIRELLIASYPPLVTTDILRAAKDDRQSILSRPFGCPQLPLDSPEPPEPLESPEPPS